MGKRAVGPAPSTTDNSAALSRKSRPIGLSKFAASVVEEVIRKQKKRRVVHDVEDTKRRDPSNTRETKKKKREDDVTDLSRLTTSTGSEPSASVSSRWTEVGELGAAQALQDEWDEPSDTLVALKMMCQQFPKFNQVAVRPFVLRSQLYSSVSDRTLVDRELEELKQQQVVRIFKLNTGNDDFGIMFIEDYLKQIEEMKKREDTRQSDEATRVFTWFAKWVVPAHNEVSIRHSHLVQLLSEAGKVNDKQVSLLIRSGLLVRQIADETTYWFSIPSVGTLLKSLSAGRKELLLFLTKRRYKEMAQAALEKKRLRTSQLDVRFHIRDLIGSGHLFVIQTPVGPVIRVARD